jgi:hypothetical protein
MKSTPSIPLVAGCVFASCTTMAVGQESGLIPAAGRADVAFDTARQILYISGGPQLRRFDMATKQFLLPVVLGGKTWALDISADGKRLAVANRSRGARQVFVDLVNLETLRSKRIAFDRSILEGGTYGVAFDADGMLLVTGANDYGASTRPPLRRYNRKTGAIEKLGDTTGVSSVTPSATHRWIAIAEGNSSAGPFGRYTTGDASYRSQVNLDHSALTQVGISPSGSQITVASYAGYVFNDLVPYAVVASTRGVAYSPTKPSVYFPITGSGSIAEYDTTTMTQVGTIAVPGTFDWPGTGPLVEGQTKVSSDGRYLFTTLDGGVFYASVSPTR